MLRFTIKAGEYFNIGDDIRVVILGGGGNNCRVMVDAPREYNIVRGRVLERSAATDAEKEKLGHYYPEPKLPPEAVKRMIAKQQRESGTAPNAGPARMKAGNPAKPEKRKTVASAEAGGTRN